MKNACKRNFKEGQIVYLIDCWGTNIGMQAFAEKAEILSVDEKNQRFVALLYGDTYQKYSFKDYGRLIFDKREEASEAADKLPKPTSFVYRVKDKKICKENVFGIYNEYIDGVTDLVIRLEGGENVPIENIGSEIFLKESDASRNKK